MVKTYTHVEDFRLETAPNNDDPEGRDHLTNEERYKPFTPLRPKGTKQAVVNRFFRYSADIVVHSILVITPQQNIKSADLYALMFPYERIGYLATQGPEDETVEDDIEKEEYAGDKHETYEGYDAQGNRIEPHADSYDGSLYNNLHHPGTNVLYCNHRRNRGFISTPVYSGGDTATGDQYHDVQIDPNNPDASVCEDAADFHLPFLIIDTRREDEYKESHIHGAINIHYGMKDHTHMELPSWLQKDTLIVTYCAVGLRSGLMQYRLRRLGFKDVRVLSGGYYKWVNEGRPIFSHTGAVAEKVLQQHSIAGLMLHDDFRLTKKDQKDYHDRKKKRGGRNGKKQEQDARRNAEKERKHHHL